MSDRIIIEGLDLVGKSTISNYIVNKNPDLFKYKKSTYSENNDLYKDVVRKSKLNLYSEETIGWLYIAAAKHELDLLKNSKEDDDNKIIIQDSFFLNRMIGVHAIKNRKIMLNEVLKLLHEFNEPRFVFYVYSDIMTRRKRFKERQAVKAPAFGDKLVFEDINDAIYREELYRSYITDLYESDIIDNSHGSIETIGDDVYHRILSLYRKD